MVLWHSSPGRLATLLVEQFLDGKVTTPEYSIWVDTLASLPAGLRESVLSQIEPVIGQHGIAKLRAQLPPPGPAEIANSTPEPVMAGDQP